MYVRYQLPLRGHPSMVDPTDIQELYRYNQWANDRVFDTIYHI